MIAVTSASPLPHLNAALNLTAFVLIGAGLVAIRSGKERAHKRFMLSAVVVSAAFLCSYLIYHFTQPPVPYTGEGAARTFYYAVLISHVVLAALVAPLLVVTVALALRDRRAAHRRMARLTAPIWIYVSVTGVIVYLMLYH